MEWQLEASAGRDADSLDDRRYILSCDAALRLRLAGFSRDAAVLWPCAGECKPLYLPGSVLYGYF
ncbi:hypothetical protein D3C86_1910690 [compost metagenome]